MKPTHPLARIRTHRNIRTHCSIRVNTGPGHTDWERLRESEQLQFKERHLTRYGRHHWR